jgi:hypothetical protein
MRDRRVSWFWPLFAAVLIGAAIGGGRHFTRPPLFEARVDVQPPTDIAVADDGTESSAAVAEEHSEELVFSPAVLSAAAQRLRQRQVAPFDRLDAASASDELSSSLRLDMRADSPNISVVCSSPDGDHALTRLQAWTDAWLETHCGPNTNADRKSAKPEDESARIARAAELQEKLNTARADVTALEQQLGGPANEVTRDLVQQEKLKSLAAAVATATARRLEAENRYVQIRRDVESGIALDLLLPRLPDGKAKQLVEAALARTRIAAEWDQLQTERRRLAQVYGSRHPRVIEMINQMIELQRTAASQPNSSDEREATPTELLLRSLAADVQEQQAIEQDVQGQLELERDSQEERAHLVAELRNAIKQATELQSELERLTAPAVSPVTKSVLAKAASVMIRPPELQPKPVRSVRVSAIEGTASAFVAWLAFVGVARWLRRERNHEPRPVRRSTPIATIQPTPLQDRRAERMLRLRLNRLKTG